MNDIEVLKSLYHTLIKAIRSVVELVRQQSGGAIATDGSLFSGGGLLSLGPIPFTVTALKRLPHVSTVKLSIWNYLRNEEFPTLRELIYAYRPYAFNPLHALPPFTKHGVLIDGQHLLTFDQRHITIPATAGGCPYILAQDMLNGNFSIVATLAGDGSGHIKSITLIDRSGFVELSADGTITVDGKDTEFPVHRGDLHAWRTYTDVTLLTEFGGRIECSTDLRHCHVTINGYYHGQLRGLLGNGNNEPYDDFLLPSNKVAENYATFTNAYRASAKLCAATPPIAFVDRTDEHARGTDLCAATFGWDSPLRLCYLFVDPANYRDTCEHAVANAATAGTAQQEAACTVARAYARTCWMEQIQVTKVPDTCARCANGDRAVGESYAAVSPQKQADIVIVVDTGVGPTLLGEFVQPIIGDLRRELKTRDIADVHVSVIGYSDELRYVNHLTTKGQLDFGGKLTAFKFDDAPKSVPPQPTGHEKLDKLLASGWQMVRTAERDLGVAADGRAFREAMAYPFRSTASNVIVAIRPDHLEFSGNPVCLVAFILHCMHVTCVCVWL